MAQITITGASDDLIEIDGDISEEWNWYHDDNAEMRWIGISDGTLLGVRYDTFGLWRFDVILRGTADLLQTIGSVQDDTNDVIALQGDIRWVMFGTDQKVSKHVAAPAPRAGATAGDAVAGDGAATEGGA